MNGYKYFKRLFDIIGATIALVVFSPLFLFIYVRLKVSGNGSVFYQQERIGLGGRPFNIYKFRTMIVNTEADGIPQLAEANDERLTPFGKSLREHHLDELPQLWNVLKGDMSFVGPRPERQYFIDKIIEHDSRYTLLYQIRPGVTSYATLYNGYTDTMEKMLRRLELDIYYLENRSWRFDLKILYKTFTSIIFGKKF